MHLYTVFDTNAYKRVSEERLDRITKAECQMGIAPFANVAVLHELFARARDADQKRRERNRAAIRKLGQHCHVKLDRTPHINLVVHTDGEVYRLITGKPHPYNHERSNRLADMVRVVTQALNDDPLVEIEVELEVIERTVAKAKQAYVQQLKAASMKQDVEPNKRTRNLTYAATIVAHAQQQYHHRFRQMREGRTLRPIMQLARYTSIGLELNDAVLEEVRRSGGGHVEHANTVWDEEVVSSTSVYTTVAGGKSIVLVTEETRLLSAANAARAADRVCNLAAYESKLGLPRWPVATDA